MPTVRVLRVLEYVGEQAAVEWQVEQSLHGSKTYNIRLDGRELGRCTIRVATVGPYPELLDMVE